MNRPILFFIVLATQCIPFACRTMRSSAEDPIGAELSGSAAPSDLDKRSEKRELELKRQTCDDMEESQNPQDGEKSIEIGVGKTLSGGSSKPYVGYRCKPK